MSDVCERLGQLECDVLRIHGVDISDQTQELIALFRAEKSAEPFSYEELMAICKRFVVEGYNGDYLENDGYELAREVEELTLKKCNALQQFAAPEKK